MYFLAPLVYALVFSGALYKTKEVWPKKAYDLLTEKKGTNKAAELIKLRSNLNKAVKDGKISPQAAKNRFLAAEKQIALEYL